MIKKIISFFFAKKIVGSVLFVKKELISKTSYEWAISSARHDIYLGIAMTRPSFIFPSSDWVIFCFSNLHNCIQESKKLCEIIISLATESGAHKSLQGDSIGIEFNKWEFKISNQKQTVRVTHLGYDNCGLQFPVCFFELLLGELEKLSVSKESNNS